MSLTKKKVNVFIVSDATGMTAEMLAASALVQFKQVEPVFKRFPNVNTKEQVAQILESAEQLGAFVVYSLVSRELRSYFRVERKRRRVNAMDLLGPLLRRMGRMWNAAPIMRPGIFKGAGQESIQLAESINFTLKHDDGQRLATVDKADLIILGISRTSKTPTSIYISCTYDLKVANIPIIPGENLPKKIFNLPQRKIGFTISPARAAFLRQKRFEYLERTDYTDLDAIRDELKHSQRLFREIRGIKLLDVTNKSIEEIATEIMESEPY